MYCRIHLWFLYNAIVSMYLYNCSIIQTRNHYKYFFFIKQLSIEVLHYILALTILNYLFELWKKIVRWKIIQTIEKSLGNLKPVFQLLFIIIFFFRQNKNYHKIHHGIFYLFYIILLPVYLKKQFIYIWIYFR